MVEHQFFNLVFSVEVGLRRAESGADWWAICTIFRGKNMEVVGQSLRYWLVIGAGWKDNRGEQGWRLGLVVCPR